MRLLVNHMQGKIYLNIISLSHAMRPGLQSAILGGKIIQLAKFCFKNKRFEPS